MNNRKWQGENRTVKYLWSKIAQTLCRSVTLSIYYPWPHTPCNYTFFWYYNSKGYRNSNQLSFKGKKKLLNSPNIKTYSPHWNEVRKYKARPLFLHLQAFELHSPCCGLCGPAARPRSASAQLSALPERTRPASSTSPEDSSACSQRPQSPLHSHSTTAGASGLLRTNKSTFNSIPPTLGNAWFFAPPSSWTQERATRAGLCPVCGISFL